MKLEEKKRIVEELHEKFARSQLVIVTDYKGLDVTTVNELRSKLREASVEYRVVKNTLLVRAAAETDVALIRDTFKGPNAVALGYDDAVAPAKALTDFAKGHKMLEIKIGVLNGKVLDLNAIKSLAALPAREILLGNLLSAMNGVPASFVRTIQAIPSKLLNVLQAIKDQKKAA